MPIAASLRPDPQFFRVQLLLVQMAAIVAVTSMMYVLPFSLSIVLLVMIYGGIVTMELWRGVRSPVSITLLFISIVFLGLGRVFTDELLQTIFPVVLFFSLCAVSAGFLAAGRPVTSFYGSKDAFLTLHWRTSALWLVVYAASLLGAWISLSSPALFWLVPCVSGVGVALTFWWQLVDMGPAWRRARCFYVGNYRFEQVTANQQNLLPFYRHFLREALPAVRQGTDDPTLSGEALLERAMTLYADSWHKATFFLAWQDNEVVGTIYCVAGNHLPLGFEDAYAPPFSLQTLRQYGRVVDINFFSIAKQHRFGQDLIQGLLRCAIEFAMENDACFLITQAYESALPVYKKIGFITLSDQIVQTRLGVPAALIGYNLARRAVCKTEQQEVSSKLQEVMSPYVMERYFKRQVIRTLLGRKQAWQLSDQDMLRLLWSQCGTRHDIQHDNRHKPQYDPQQSSPSRPAAAASQVKAMQDE